MLILDFRNIFPLVECRDTTVESWTDCQCIRTRYNYSVIAGGCGCRDLFSGDGGFYGSPNALYQFKDNRYTLCVELMS